MSRMVGVATDTRRTAPVPPSGPGALHCEFLHRLTCTNPHPWPRDASRAGLASSMGIRNYLIEGVSGTGKTSVFRELRRRGYHAINGDTELAYQGDPITGEPLDGLTHEHHIWHLEKVRALVADRDEPVTFFCGGSRNFPAFIELFDEVFILDVDRDTLQRRLDERGESEWGGKPQERQLIERLHRTSEDLPAHGVVLDATAPIARVVDDIVRHAGA